MLNKPKINLPNRESQIHFSRCYYPTPRYWLPVLNDKKNCDQLRVSLKSEYKFKTTIVV